MIAIFSDIHILIIASVKYCLEVSPEYLIRLTQSIESVIRRQNCDQIILEIGFVWRAALRHSDITRLHLTTLNSKTKCANEICISPLAHTSARRRWEQLPDKTCMTRGAVRQRGPRGIKITLFRQLRTYAKYAPRWLWVLMNFYGIIIKPLSGLCGRTRGRAFACTRRGRPRVCETQHGAASRRSALSPFARPVIASYTRATVLYSRGFFTDRVVRVRTDKWSRHVSRC